MNFRQRIGNLTAQRVFLLLEALFHLMAARIALGLLPYRLYERLLKVETPVAARIDTVTAKAVGSAVSRMAGMIPWRSDCLPQATAAQWMLRRRKISTRLCIGVALEHEPFHAHAWLVHHSVVLTGRKGHNRFRTIRSY